MGGDSNSKPAQPSPEDLKHNMATLCRTASPINLDGVDFSTDDSQVCFLLLKFEGDYEPIKEQLFKIAKRQQHTKCWRATPKMKTQLVSALPGNAKKNNWKNPHFVDLA